MTIVIHVVMMGELLGGYSRGVWRHGESVCVRENRQNDERDVRGAAIKTKSSELLLPVIAKVVRKHRGSCLICPWGITTLRREEFEPEKPCTL